MSKFKEGERVVGYVPNHRSVFGTVKNPKTPYSMVEILWDDQSIEDTHLYPGSLSHVTPEEEREADLEEAERLLTKHGLKIDDGFEPQNHCEHCPENESYR